MPLVDPQKGAAFERSVAVSRASGFPTLAILPNPDPQGACVPVGSDFRGMDCVTRVDICPSAAN